MTIEWRTIGFPHHLMQVETESMRLANIQIASGSQIANFVRATGLISQLWVGKFDMSMMDRPQWQEWQSFIARLSGQAVLFEIFAPSRRLPEGAGGGFEEGGSAYTITGTTITGVTLRQGATTGLVLQAAPRYARAILVDFGDDMAGETVLTHGDVFGLGGNLYLVTGPVTADANGHARVAFAWKLHKAARVGDIVNFRKPSCRAMLQSANDGDMSITPPNFGKGAISFVEVPYT